MNNLNNKPITSKQANTFRNSWKECLSNEISNLFYQAEKTGPVERYNSYFGLGKAGIAAILATGIPLAFATNGTVLLALGFTSKT